MGAVLLGLAILTRPAGLYFPLIFALIILARGAGANGFGTAVRKAALLILFSLSLVGGWVARNNSVFSLRHLTNNDAIVLVYFAGAGGYQMKYGLNLQEAQARISHEFQLPPPEVTFNHWITDQPVAEMDAALRGAVRAVLFNHPFGVIAGCVRGIVKASFSHNMSLFSVMLGRDWIATGSGSGSSADASLGRVFQNGPFMAFGFFWQLLHCFVTYCLSVYGMVVALRARHQRFRVALLLAAILSYCFLTVAIVGPDAYYRFRTPHMPFIFMLAGLAASTIQNRWTRSTDGTELN